jgi:integrase
MPRSKAKNLTVEAIRRARRGARLKDSAPGLVVHVLPTGRRVFVFRARGGGTTRGGHARVRKVVLGEVDLGREQPEPLPGRQKLTLAEARARAADMQVRRRRGANVFVRSAPAGGAKTFDAVAREFIEQHAKRETRNWQPTARLLGYRCAADGSLTVAEDSLADQWVKRPMASIDSDELHQAIEDAVETAVPGRAVRAQGPNKHRGRALGRTLGTLFRWARKKKRYIKTNPMEGVHVPLSGGEELSRLERDRFLSTAEIAVLWKALDAAGDLQARVLKILLLTGQRLNEIRRMRWDEIADDGDEWTLVLPRERTKSRRAHKVPLSISVKALIEGAPRVAGSPFVFSINGRNPVYLGDRQKQAIDKKAKIAPWRFHDLRRTFETHAIEMGISPDLVERITNHALPGMRRVYDRSERLGERRAALDAWAQRVDRIVRGEEQSNVVALRGGPA